MRTRPLQWRCHRTLGARAATRGRAALALLALCTLLLPAERAPAQGLASDPRAQPSAPPSSYKALISRFLPGFELAAPPVRGPLNPLDEQALAIETQPGVCYGAAAFSTEVEDLDVRVYFNGALVAQDVRPDAYPVATYCASARGTLRAVARAHAGAGDSTLAMLVEINAASAAAGPRDELSNRLEAAIRRGTARWLPDGPQWRHTFPVAGIARYDATLAAGTCYAFVTVGQSTVLDLDLRLTTPDGTQTTDLTLDATPLLVQCPTEPMAIAIDVAVTRGTGTVAIQRMQRPQRGRTPSPTPPRP